MTSQADEILPAAPVKKLPQGAKIGVVAPSAVFCEKKLASGMKCLQELGYEPVFSPFSGSEKENLFAAASVKERVSQIHDYLTDNEIKALFCVRGGYGSAELLPHLNFELFKRSEKPFVGFSDNTVLLANYTERSGLITFHGPQVASAFASANENRECGQSISTLLGLLSGSVENLSYTGRSIKSAKSKQGQLLAGNLTMLCSLLGTPWDVSYEDKILVVEEVSEAPYRVHRLLMQLLFAGKLSNLSGLCFGSFTEDEKTNQAVESFVSNYLSKFNFPVVADLPVGHGDLNLPLPLGGKCEVNKDELIILSPSVCA